jgi:thiamine monophosphate kinase
VLLCGLAAHAGPQAADYPDAVAAQRRPQAQLALGAWLAREGLASACIDLSDSLSQCLLQLAQASGVGLDIDLQDYKLHPEVEAFVAAHSAQPLRDPALSARKEELCGEIELPPLLDPQGKGLRYASAAEYLLASAEDYQLLFCAPPQSTAQLQNACPVPLTCIGTVLPAAAGCHWRADNSGAELQASGWQHR